MYIPPQNLSKLEHTPHKTDAIGVYRHALFRGIPGCFLIPGAFLLEVGSAIQDDKHQSQPG